jgi:tryptophan-rich sensory protein
MRKPIRLIVAILLPVLVGAISGFFTASSVKTWYVTLNKPSFNPPSYVFAPVWTTLYILMGIAFYLVWVSVTDKAQQRKAMAVYFIQLFLNFCWSFIFFYKQRPDLAFIEIVFLWISIVATLVLFYRISKPAGWLLVPYLFWVSFASALNYAIWQLNP